MTSPQSAHPTLQDLLREAGGSVPVMLAVTILVQVLGALERRRRRGFATGRLSLDDVCLTGAPPLALLNDPSRDPRVRIAPEPDGTPRTELSGAGALFRALLGASRPEVPLPAARLLRTLRDPGEQKRLSLEQALAHARELGLELLAAWDRRRDSSLKAPSAEDVARQELATALYDGRRREVVRQGRQLRRILGTGAADDDDLAVARGWLEEQAESRARQRDRARKTSLKLVLTGAPLVLATLLTGLLGVVMLFSV